MKTWTFYSDALIPSRRLHGSICFVAFSPLLLDGTIKIADRQQFDGWKLLDTLQYEVLPVYDLESNALQGKP